MLNQYRAVGFAVLTIILLALSQLSAAQMLPEAATIVAQPPKDKFLMLAPPRDINEIQSDIASAEWDRTTSSEAERTAQEQRSTAKAKIDEKKQAIASNKERLKIAKKEKNGSETLLLTTLGKALNRDKKMFEQREALRDAEIDLAKKRVELAILMKQAFDLERQLAIKRAEQPETIANELDAARTSRLLIDMEKATLEAQKTVANKQGEVADGAKKVVIRQLKTLEAQRNIYAGK
jgi:hypothetical protein